MAFVDQARIEVQAGGGGKAVKAITAISTRVFPICNGGDGGRGATIIFQADRNLHTLLDYRFKQHYVGERGGTPVVIIKQAKGAKILFYAFRWNSLVGL